MPAHKSAAPAAVVRQRKIRSHLLAIAGLAAMTGACANVPRTTLAGPDPSDPKAHASPVKYRSTLGSYRSQRPVDAATNAGESAPQPKP
ncbi:MAG TPA: hypothetical protein VGI22_01970 [Xanthobacteraceae bacterium]|jgi:hypothetical protein